MGIIESTYNIGRNINIDNPVLVWCDKINSSTKGNTYILGIKINLNTYKFEGIQCEEFDKQKELQLKYLYKNAKGQEKFITPIGNIVNIKNTSKKDIKEILEKIEKK
jgi:hypothetical protein